MISLEILLYILAFLLGSVLSTLLINRMYEKEVSYDDVELKNLSAKRFYKAIGGLVLVALIILVAILGHPDGLDLFKDQSWIVTAVVIVFLVYVLLIEKTIILIRLPIKKWWVSGAPRRAKRKKKRIIKRQENKAVKAQEKKRAEEAKALGAYVLPKRDYVKPPAKLVSTPLEGTLEMSEPKDIETVVVRESPFPVKPTKIYPPKKEK